ncbi:MAG: glycosyltransferase family 4 protein [Deltaproteobacteria bacterium]
MKIAQVAPLAESVPPRLYGGTERVVSYLTEELIKQGHEVTLFASGDSVTSARLVSPVDECIRLSKTYLNSIPHEYIMNEMISRESGNFDIIHFHTDYIHFPVSRREKYAHLTTLHGRLDLPELKNIYSEFNEIPVVSISYDQRSYLPQANWIGNAYHGLPTKLYNLNGDEGKYLAFLGRISPEKRPDRAIRIARLTGIPLKIAAKVDSVDTDYYESVIEPMLDNPLVEFIGEIGEDEKNDFLGNALALLFPIDWPEPFGLAMIESMACGTPVIAFNCGSVPEVVDDGKTGFIVNNMREAVEAVYKIQSLSRSKIRETFESRFSAAKMAGDYSLLYKKILKNSMIQEVA